MTQVRQRVAPPVPVAMQIVAPFVVDAAGETIIVYARGVRSVQRAAARILPGADPFHVRLASPSDVSIGLLIGWRLYRVGK